SYQVDQGGESIQYKVEGARVIDRIRTCAIPNSDSKSNVLDRLASDTPNYRFKRRRC
ncbi:hypothetical protein J6590_091618, partial [Homalodisca vitripennis]